MANPGYTMFLLNNIRSRPRAPPADIFRLFYKKIQEQQLKEIIVLKKALDIIDTNVRQINVVTDDPEEKKRILLQTQILLKVAHEIRETHAKPGSEFLNALELVLKFKPEN
jgi:hypothetical protein